MFSFRYLFAQKGITKRRPLLTASVIVGLIPLGFSNSLHSNSENP